MRRQCTVRTWNRYLQRLGQRQGPQTMTWSLKEHGNEVFSSIVDITCKRRYTPLSQLVPAYIWTQGTRALDPLNIFLSHFCNSVHLLCIRRLGWPSTSSPIESSSYPDISTLLRPRLSVEPSRRPSSSLLACSKPASDCGVFAGSDWI
jgi:hypothetical protein